jgi:hypothetical protein
MTLLSLAIGPLRRKPKSLRYAPSMRAWQVAVLVALAGNASVSAAEAPNAPSCGQQGRVSFDDTALLVDANGRKLARFSGGESAVVLLSPPARGSDLLRIQTGTGRGSFRIEGYLKAADLRLFTSSDVQAVSGHVWINAGTRVTLVGSSAAQVKIEKRLSTPLQQVFGAAVTCSTLTFNPPTKEQPSVPNSARTFLMKGNDLELFAQPAAPSPVTSLHRAPQVDSVAFLSTEQRGGFVHVQYFGEVRIDGWAKASELVPLARGEFAETWSGGYSLTSPPRLQLQQEPRVVRTSRELPLRLAAREAEKPIGVIEPETELYVMDTVAGWANVLPKSLHVLPAESSSFWVKAGDLGL